MEKLGSDVVEEILARLPKTDIKTILQCRKVCRLWRCLLGKRKTGILFTYILKRFGDVYLHYTEQQSSELVKLNFNKTNTNSSMGTNSPHSFILVGSCNGLVCYTTFEPRVGDVMYICNPITGESTRVTEMGACLKYGARSGYIIGFGYCHSINSYKVFRISCTEVGEKLVQVYTLGDGSGWRDTQEYTYNLSRSGVFANGALYWLNGESSEGPFDIVAFDLADETFQSLPSPPFHIPSSSYMSVTLEGDLCLCLRFINQGDCMTDIWVFKKEDINLCSWIKVFSRKWNVDLTKKCLPLSLTESEILLWQDEVLHRFDSKTTELKRLWYLVGLADGYTQAIPHMNSLVWLKDLGEEQADC